MSKTIKEWQDHVWQINEDHGFHDSPATVDTRLMLAVGELSEAQEELRAGHGLTEVYYKADNPDKPEGFPVEVADCVIRCLDLAGTYGIDLEAMIDLKSAYNETRPYRHGKKF